MKVIRKITNFLALLVIKILGQLFYSIKVEWLHPVGKNPLKNVRLITYLNHTSLLEFIFIAGFPIGFLWRCAGKTVVPAADITMNRPVTGRIISLISPKMIPISRERDGTWSHFLEEIDADSVVAIAPEGRMKREDGLDKHGKPMTVRGGVADILQLLGSGDMLMMYSRGLHHVQIPGKGFPKLFKKVHVRVELVDIAEYIKSMENRPEKVFRKAVIADMEARRDKHSA